MAGVVLPRLLSRLGEAREAFEAFTRAIDKDPETALGDGPGLAEVEERQADCHRLGWCLGVIAAARGSNLLRARRQREGLPDLLELVEESLSTRFVPDVTLLPALRPMVGEGWQVPFVLAYLFFCAGRGRRSTCAWSLTQGDGRAWVLTLEGQGPPSAELIEELRDLTPELSLEETSSDQVRARFPIHWLERGR